MAWESTGSTSTTNHVSQPNILDNFDNYHMFIENLMADSE